MNVERQSYYPLPPIGNAYSSASSSPRVGSTASFAGSQSSYTSVASSVGPKTPSPTLPGNAITAPATSIISYDAMNQGDMYYPQHMSAGQPQPPQTVTSGLGHYQQHQPPMLPSAHTQYNAPYHYGYSNGLTSPGAAAPPVSNGIPQNVLPLPGSQGPLSQAYAAGFDTTGQQPPVGAKPRVTATLWEDEGSLCFQVEARGICVARREDNHMINGTKLLNVAGMTRGRRDGILKSEKVRHVVKIGPMHLKGVWIPYDRALEFANKEKITELLYPLFVNNIGAMLYHPANQTRTNQVMAAADRRKQEQQGGQTQVRPHPVTGLPSMQQQPQHAMATLPSHSPLGRPSLERAHTFPTPPTSASSVMGSGMPASDNFNWQGQGMNGQQATTPPSASMQNMPPYGSNASGYDGQRQMYGNPSSQPSPYQNGNQDRMYGQPGQYPKNEMAPPSGRPSISAQGQEQDTKPIMSQEHSSQPHNGEEEGEQEHEAEYTHDSGSYDAARTQYNYAAPPVAGMPHEGNIAPEMTGSPNHTSTSGRATPRTAPPTQPYYQNPGYNTPPRVQQSGNLYNVVSDNRAPTNGVASADGYAPAADMNGSMTNGYASQQPSLNGSVKRGRDDEDDMSRNGGDMDLKRRRMMETAVPAPIYDAMNRSAPPVAAPRRV